ncbi:anti-sigma factor domain-containing protein [Streptomyces sp. NPDC004082]|uniref:anti-sigma factor n=1 Tax=unclassified Streptomyces TaxID=2593676 RepID=UPI0033BD0B0A
MTHVDEEALVLIALGELPATSDDELHLQSCSVCQAEVESYRRVVTAARTPQLDEDDLIQPPAQLWADITAELSLSEDAFTEFPAANEEPHAILTGEREGDGHAVHASASTDTPATAQRRRVRRRARFSVALAACAALLGAGAGSTITWWALRTDSTTTTPSAKPLDSLRPASTGYASLRGTQAHRTLAIEVKGLPDTTGYFEVWLMNRSHTKLVSMGVLNADGQATLPVPKNIDLREYSVVDVSVQPYNGKPDHSGKSIVRGPYAS